MLRRMCEKERAAAKQTSILLFPVVVALTILVAVCRFICSFSGIVLAVLAGLLFLIGLGTLLCCEIRAAAFSTSCLPS